MKLKSTYLLVFSSTLLLSTLLFVLTINNVWGYDVDGPEDFEDTSYIDHFNATINANCYRDNSYALNGTWSFRMNTGSNCWINVANNSELYYLDFEWWDIYGGTSLTVNFYDIDLNWLKSSQTYGSTENFTKHNLEYATIEELSDFPVWVKFEVASGGYDALWVDNVTITYSLTELPPEELNMLSPYYNINVDADTDQNLNNTNTLSSSVSSDPNNNVTNILNSFVSSDPHNNVTNYLNFGIYKDFFNNITNSKNVTVDTSPDFTIINLFLLEASGGGGCNVNDISITNYEADTWVFAEEKYYNFFVRYSAVNLTAIPDMSLAIQLTDGIHNMTIQYYPDTGIYEVLSGSDQVRVPRNNATGWIQYDNDLLLLNITYPIFFTDEVIDTFEGKASAFCDGLWSDPDDFIFKIYNKGGLIAYKELFALGGSGGFTIGGDWFEGCTEYYGIIQANQTWRKIQSLQYQYSLRFYENVTGTWVPEDQFMQHAQNDGGGAEKSAGVADWHIRYKIWVWDTVTSAYVLQGYIDSYLIDGDEGASDEWIAIKNIIYEKTTEKLNKTWNGFIQEEPSARLGVWTDIWFNRVNGSSIMGFSTNPYYYGMDDSGYMFWSTWAPQLDNGTEAMGFIRLKDGYGNYTVASQFDLMKIEFELESVGFGGSGERYRVCVEDVNVQEVNLGDRGSPLFGIDTPSPNKPLVVDMAQGGLLAPLYNAIKGIADQIWSALSSATGLIWAGIGARFPWFTGFFDDLIDFLVGTSGIFTVIMGYIIGLINFLFGFIDYIAQPIGVITELWDILVENTAIFFAVDPVAVSQVLILVVVFVPLIEAMTRGDTSYVINFAEKVWRMVNWLIQIFINVGGRIVSWIMEAIPF